MQKSTTWRLWVQLAVCFTVVVVGSSDASAIGPKTKVRLAQLKYNGNWNPRPKAVPKLLQELRFTTSIPVELAPKVVTLRDPKLFYHPMLLIAGDKPLPAFSHADRATLRKYLQLGGFIWFDTASAGTQRTFESSVKKLITQLFPGKKMQKVPSDHVIYRSFFRVNAPAGRVMTKRYVEGLALDRRLCLVLTSNDVLGALELDRFGNWKYEPTPLGPAQRRTAMRFAINLIEYSLCLNYKSDQVHLDYLLRKRKWYIRRPKAP